jgi:hypothetical protein
LNRAKAGFVVQRTDAATLILFATLNYRPLPKTRMTESRPATVVQVSVYWREMNDPAMNSRMIDAYAALGHL